MTCDVKPTINANQMHYVSRHETPICRSNRSNRWNCSGACPVSCTASARRGRHRQPGARLGRPDHGGYFRDLRIDRAARFQCQIAALRPHHVDLLCGPKTVVHHRHEFTALRISGNRPWPQRETRVRTTSCVSMNRLICSQSRTGSLPAQQIVKIVHTMHIVDLKGIFL